MALESSQPIFWCQNADYNVAEAPEVVEVEMFQSSLVISPAAAGLGRVCGVTDARRSSA